MTSKIYLIGGAMLKPKNINPLLSQIIKNYKNIVEQIITNQQLHRKIYQSLICYIIPLISKI